MGLHAGASLDADTYLISTRQRVVWTLAERKRLDRCAKDFNSHGDKLQLRCGNMTCPEPTMHLAADWSAPGGAVLRCGCTDRVFSPTV
jgi:hypothetical protein